MRVQVGLTIMVHIRISFCFHLYFIRSASSCFIGMTQPSMQRRPWLETAREQLEAVHGQVGPPSVAQWRKATQELNLPEQQKFHRDKAPPAKPAEEELKEKITEMLRALSLWFSIFSKFHTRFKQLH